MAPSWLRPKGDSCLNRYRNRERKRAPKKQTTCLIEQACLSIEEINNKGLDHIICKEKETRRRTIAEKRNKGQGRKKHGTEKEKGKRKKVN
jgi:hypothetical protein